MGLFDNVIAEEETGTTTTSQTQGGSSSSQGGSSSDDGGFLILGDSPAQAFSVPEIKAEDIPDSAVSFLDLSALSASPVANTEMIADIQDVTMLPDAKEADGFSLFLDSEDQKISDMIVTEKEDVFLAADDIALQSEAMQGEPIQIPQIQEKAEEAQIFSGATDVAEAVIKNPFEILDKAIEDLLDLLKGHEAVRNEKMATVDVINEQISALKSQAKKLTEESRNISLEEEKVNKMISTFKAQKV